jgi:NADH-quinone oxidoreductase subunit I
MGVLVKKVELNWLDRTYFWPIAKGMAITLGHFLRQITTSTAKRYTIQYPDMKKTLPPGYRGLHELKRFEDGAIKCVACFMCAEACPARCITIEAEEFGELNCGMCEEACPKDAIWLRNEYEVADYARLSLNYGKWDLMNSYAAKDGKSVLTQDPTPATPRRVVAL